MTEPKIENKPDYCHCWISKVSDNVMCNSIPCCGFYIYEEVPEIRKAKGHKFSWDKEGRNQLVNGKFIFNK